MRKRLLHDKEVLDYNPDLVLLSVALACSQSLRMFSQCSFRALFVFTFYSASFLKQWGVSHSLITGCCSRSRLYLRMTISVKGDSICHLVCVTNRGLQTPARKTLKMSPFVLRISQTTDCMFKSVNTTMTRRAWLLVAFNVWFSSP